MGAMISTVISSIALVVIGVLSVMTALKTRQLTDADRKDAHKTATWAAIMSFVVAVLSATVQFFSIREQ